jgi:hypothetical protein
VQRIRFGLTLDGERGWHPRDALGESTVGPLGLLSILETQLGLSRSAPSHAERVAGAGMPQSGMQWHSLLRKAL